MKPVPREQLRELLRWYIFERVNPPSLESYDFDGLAARVRDNIRSTLKVPKYHVRSEIRVMSGEGLLRINTRGEYLLTNKGCHYYARLQARRGVDGK